MSDDPNPNPPTIDDALDELEELESLVDRDEEREQVREAMTVLRRAERPSVFGRLRDRFDLRDAGEALVGSFLFGIPMVVEDGTRDIGAYIAVRPLYLVVTLAIGLATTVGILYAVGFEEVEADLIGGVVPRRLLGILAVAFGLAALLMTVWGRADWSRPAVGASQTLVTGVVMVVGASLGDVIPDS